MIDNNYEPGNSLGQFFKRTNPLADKCNTMIMKVERQYCENIEIVGDFVVSGAGAALTFTAGAPTNALDVRYFQIVVKDEFGKTASKTAVNTDLAAPVVVDTSALDANTNWYLGIEVSDDKNINTSNNCKTFGIIYVEGPSSNPTVSINTITQDAQVVKVFQADGATEIANGGAAYDLGTFAAGGTTEAAKIVLNNPGGFVLKVSSAVVGGDVSAVSSSLPQYVYIDQKVELDFLIDSSGGAGGYTGSITLTTDDPVTPSFVVNVSFTLA